MSINSEGVNSITKLSSKDIANIYIKTHKVIASKINAGIAKRMYKRNKKLFWKNFGVNLKPFFLSRKKTIIGGKITNTWTKGYA